MGSIQLPSQRCSTLNIKWIAAQDPYRPEERILTSVVFLGQIHEAQECMKDVSGSGII